MTTQAVDDAGAARGGDRITRAGRPAGATRAGRGRPPRDEAAQRARLEDFHQRLSEQVLALSDGPTWKAWLLTAAKFHDYSFNNTVSILMQYPDAVQVAGYRTWQSLGRQVRKGEQGIQILAPVLLRQDVDGPNGDQLGRAAVRVGGRAGEPPTEPLTGDRRVLVGVRIAHVFDISQTDGDPLPQPDPAWRPTLLTGQAPDGLWDGLALQVAEAGYELSLQYPAGGANGLTMYGPRQVLVRPDVDEAQRVKTLAHELGHVMLHAPVDPENRNVEQRCRGQQEVEAESVAFLVASAHGMDTGQYSFAYVAGWAYDAATNNGGDVETTLRLSASRALTTAHRVLDRLNREISSSTVIDAEDTIPAHLRTPAPAVRLAPSAEATNTAPHRRPPAVGVGP